MTTFKLRHGPVTITVEGLPATVRPEAITIDVGIHCSFEPEYRENVDAFVENFAALGGRTTFPQVDPAKRSSCGSYATDQGLTSRLGLYPPDPPVVPGEEAIRAALNGQETGREPKICGRLLVGQGGDTWDPICTQPSGHEGGCRP